MIFYVIDVIRLLAKRACFLRSNMNDPLDLLYFKIIVMTNEFTQQQDETSQTEGPLARNIEKQTAKVPSDVYLWAAVAAMGTSLTLKICGRKHDALFIGQWAAPFLLFGIYNKIVKVAGHDRSAGAGEDEAVGEDD
jgi:hypothetical protein